MPRKRIVKHRRPGRPRTKVGGRRKVYRKVGRPKTTGGRRKVYRKVGRPKTTGGRRKVYRKVGRPKKTVGRRKYYGGSVPEMPRVVIKSGALDLLRNPTKTNMFSRLGDALTSMRQHHTISNGLKSAGWNKLSSFAKMLGFGKRKRKVGGSIFGSLVSARRFVDKIKAQQAKKNGTGKRRVKRGGMSLPELQRLTKMNPARRAQYDAIRYKYRNGAVGAHMGGAKRLRMKGKGFFGNIWRGIKKAASWVNDKLKQSKIISTVAPMLGPLGGPVGTAAKLAGYGRRRTIRKKYGKGKLGDLWTSAKMMYQTPLFQSWMKTGKGKRRITRK